MAHQEESVLNSLLQKFMDKQNVTRKSNVLRRDPDNEFSHKHDLITNFEMGNVDEVHQLLSKQIPLAKFDDDMDILIAGKDMSLVINPLFQIKQQEDNDDAKIVLEDLLMFFYTPYVAKLMLTRSKEGFERELQANRTAKKKKRGFSLANLRNNKEEDENDEVYFD